MAASVAVAWVAGCSFVPDAVSPIEWYKGVRGWFGDGKTEDQRRAEAAVRGEPIPGGSGPFPNLATVPPRPASPDEPAARVRDRLIEDRGSAETGDAELRERAAREAIPLPTLPARRGAAAIPVPEPPRSVAPPPMPKLVRPPPPPSLGDPASGGTPP